MIGQIIPVPDGEERSEERSLGSLRLLVDLAIQNIPSLLWRDAGEVSQSRLSEIRPRLDDGLTILLQQSCHSLGLEDRNAGPVLILCVGRPPIGVSAGD